MKKPTLILFSYKSHKHGYIEMLFARLSEKAAQRSIDLKRAALKELHITVKNNRLNVYDPISEKDLNYYGAVYFELWYKCPQQALATALYCQKNHIPFFSEELLHAMPVTKVGEIAKLADGNIPLPNTFTSSNSQIKKVFKNKQSSPFLYPFILKADDGYGGKCNFLVKDRPHLYEIIKLHPKNTFVAQQFIPNDCDYRCLVLNNQIKFVLKRSRIHTATHLNNTSAGGEGVAVSLSSIPKQARMDVVSAAKRLHRGQFAGVDLIIDKETGQHYILEVNQTPQIEIGAETDKKMNALLDYIEEVSQ